MIFFKCGNDIENLWRRWFGWCFRKDLGTNLFDLKRIWGPASFWAMKTLVSIKILKYAIPLSLAVPGSIQSCSRTPPPSLPQKACSIFPNVVQPFCLVGRNIDMRRALCKPKNGCPKLKLNGVFFTPHPTPALSGSALLCNAGQYCGEEGDRGFPYWCPQHHHSQNAAIISEEGRNQTSLKLTFCLNFFF